MSALEPRTIILHGRRVTYLQAGQGPVLLLIHGLAGSCENWRSVIGPLAANHTVLAADLPGHGASEPSGGDYSLGSLASGLRDLLAALGHECATLVGHSLGGGIAMQLAYQFPEMAGRLILVSSGGLGREVNPILRAAALPGADLLIAATARAGRIASSALGSGLQALGLQANADYAEIARGYATLADGEHRAAFLSTLRGVIDIDGQRVCASDRLHLIDGLPILILWGAEDRVIPVTHGQEAHHALPGSRLEIFDGVGHLPQIQAPSQFVAVLERFLSETQSAPWDIELWRAKLTPTAEPDAGVRSAARSLRPLPRLAQRT